MRGKMREIYPPRGGRAWDASEMCESHARCVIFGRTDCNTLANVPPMRVPHGHSHVLLPTKSSYETHIGPFHKCTKLFSSHRSHLRPTWALSYTFAHARPIWDLFINVRNLSAHIGPTCVPHERCHVLPPIPDPYSSHMGSKTPSSSHMRPIWEMSAHMRQVNTIWVLYSIVWRVSEYWGANVVNILHNLDKIPRCMSPKTCGISKWKPC